MHNWTDFRFSARDGLKLHARVYGERGLPGLPVLCLAGMTRNASDFHELATYLSQRETNPRQVICMDCRGRGLSEWDRDWRNYTVLVETDDVLHALTALGLGDILVVGTSRGGILAMLLACLRPGILAGAVLNDVGPEIDGRGLARLKSYIGRIGLPADWEQAANQIQGLFGAKFPALNGTVWERYARGTYKETDGKLVLDYDPAISKQLKQIDLSRSVPTLWPQFRALCRVPVFTLRGEHSDLLNEETFAAMQAFCPAMRSLVVKGQGHAPWLAEKALIEPISAFLDAAEKARAH